MWPRGKAADGDFRSRHSLQSGLGVPRLQVGREQGGDDETRQGEDKEATEAEQPEEFQGGGRALETPGWLEGAMETTCSALVSLDSALGTTPSYGWLASIILA